MLHVSFLLFLLVVKHGGRLDQEGGAQHEQVICVLALCGRLWELHEEGTHRGYSCQVVLVES